jgi:transcriptional regulator with XRE-family HTH domain
MRYKERLRSLREEHDLTQDRVAKVIGVSQRTYSDYESGRLRVPVDRLVDLAEFYDCSVDYISGASDIRRPYPGR